VNVGAAFTVNADACVTLLESVFRIVRLRALAVALPAIVTFAVMCVASVNVVLLTVMPVPLKDATAPLAKPLPTIARFLFVP
jgi:hypothetical protein